MDNPQFPVEPTPKIRSAANTLKTMMAKANRWKAKGAPALTRRQKSACDAAAGLGAKRTNRLAEVR
jgi:hypothetical protein